MLIAIYARVSTDKQDNDNQLIQLREFASKQGWIIVAEYVDTVSGSGKKERPQFKRMILEASQRQFDLLLFWKLDRLSREGTRRTLVISRNWTPGMSRGAHSWNLISTRAGL
jgi:DNA invertase Pin-like site-specific DNA recombinase